MKFKLSRILAIFVLLSCLFAQFSNALDIAAISSFVSPKVIKCYKCSSLLNDDCKNITNSLKRDDMIEECLPGAQGCVKQWVKKHDGRNATFRECYYGSISPFYTNFQCERIPRNSLYDKVQCYKCRGSLCNNSNRFHSSFGILFNSLLLIIISYVL